MKIFKNTNVKFATLIILILTMLVGCGDKTVDTATETEATKVATETPEPNPETIPEPISENVVEENISSDAINLETEESKIVYKNHELADKDGKPVLIVYFDYTNKKEEPNSSDVTPKS